MHVLSVCNFRRYSVVPIVIFIILIGIVFVLYLKRCICEEITLKVKVNPGRTLMIVVKI